MTNIISRPAPKHLLVGPVRVAWPHFFRPRTSTVNGKTRTRYEGTILVPKTADDIIVAVRAEVKAAWVAKFGEAKKMPIDASPLRDGDKPTTEDDPHDKGKYPGFVYFNVSAKEDSPPALLDADRAPLLDPLKIQSGDWILAMLNPYAYLVPDGSGAGVAVGIVAAQFSRRGEPIGSGKMEDGAIRDAFAGLPAIEGIDEAEAF